MRRPAALALAAAGLALAAAAPAQAQETATQRFFSERLQSDKQTSTEIKDLLRTRQGFVDRKVVFRDLTGDKRQDAVVRVQSGGVLALVASEVAEHDLAVDEALAGAQEVLDLRAGLLVGLQALGEEPLGCGLLRVRGRRGGEGETGGGQGDVCPARHQGSSRVSCADLRSGPTSTMAGLGPFFTLRA